MPVASLRLPDGELRLFPAGGGEITRRVAQLYKDYVADYVREHAAESFFAPPGR
jgi:hypothetical protein